METLRVLYILFTTGACNLRCSYCGGSFDPRIVPWAPTYDTKILIEFLKRDPEPIVAFYGGEPLLNPKLIEEVMDELGGSARFVIQTNGLLVPRVKKEILLRMDTILLSIDGVEWLTDKHRGRGVYRSAVNAARYLRSIGFGGDLVARMTVTEDTDIHRDVSHLLELGLFDHVHWQLNVVWAERWGFEEWAEKSYLPGVERLAEIWVRRIEAGEVLGIAPFQGILKRHLEGGSYPPCGAGADAVAISTDGRVLACPIAVQEKWAELGNIYELGSLKLGGYSDEMRRECGRCEYFRECGGRCLYAFKERLWGKQGFESVCNVTKATIRAVLARKNRIIKAVEKGLVSWDALLYPKYNNTVEIIP